MLNQIPPGQRSLTSGAMGRVRGFGKSGGGGTAVSVATSISVNPASASFAKGKTQQFTATVLDQFGQNMGLSVTWSSNSANASINSSTGLASGDAYGAATITATYQSLTNTASATVQQPTQLAMVTQPAGATTGSAFSTQPVVELRDAGGNPDAESGRTVTVSISAGTGTLSGTTSILTDANGRAVFTDLAISATSPPSSFTLTFASTGLTGTSSTSFTVNSSSAWAANLTAAGLNTLLDQLDFTQTVPTWTDNGAGGGSERFLPSPANAWSVISDPNPSSGEGIFKATRSGGNNSSPSVWEFRMNAGSVGGGVPGAGSSGGYGDLGRPINLSEFGIAFSIYFSPNFYFHPVSHKLFHFEMAGASQFFLVQLAHNLDFFRASDENAGVGYEPQDGTQPSTDAWHQVEIYLKRGAAGTGIMKVWCDGVLRNSVTNLAIAPTGNFTTISFDTTMGGGGYTLTASQLIAVDHLSVYTP